MSNISKKKIANSFIFSATIERNYPFLVHNLNFANISTYLNVLKDYFRLESDW